MYGKYDKKKRSVLERFNHNTQFNPSYTHQTTLLKCLHAFLRVTLFRITLFPSSKSFLLGWCVLLKYLHTLHRGCNLQKDNRQVRCRHLLPDTCLPVRKLKNTCHVVKTLNNVLTRDAHTRKKINTHIHIRQHTCV